MVVATAKNYAVKTDNIFTVSDGARKAFTGNKDLTAILNELSGRYGQIWTGTKPSSPAAGDLFFSSSTGLEIYTGSSWNIIIGNSIAVEVFSGSKSSYGWEEAAQHIAYDEYTNPSTPGVQPSTGDLIIVTDNGTSETFIIKAMAAAPASYSDFTVEHITTKNAAEINYDNTTSGLSATNVQDAIDELKGEVSSLDYNWGKYENETAMTGTLANDVVLATIGGKGVPATGLKMLTCKVCIKATGTGGYIACGTRNMVFDGTTVKAAAETVTNYFTDWDSENTMPLDVDEVSLSFVNNTFTASVPSGTAFGSLSAIVSVEVMY